MTMLALLKTLPAVFAIQAGVREPLDADAVAELHGRVLCVRADGDDDADTLRRVSTRNE